MRNTTDKIEELADALKEYAENRMVSVKLEAAEKASGFIGDMTAGMIVAIISLLVLFFLGLALSFFLNGVLGNTWLGFLISGGLYASLGIVLWMRKDSIIRLRVLNSMIGKLFRSHEKDS